MRIQLSDRNIFSPHNAVLQSALNGVSRIVNLSDIHLADPLGIFLTNNIPVTHCGRDTRVIFNLQLLPDLKWPYIVGKRPHIDG